MSEGTIYDTVRITDDMRVSAARSSNLIRVEIDGERELLDRDAAVLLTRELARRVGLVVVDPELARTLQKIDFGDAAQALLDAIDEERDRPGDLPKATAALDAFVLAIVEKVLTASPGGSKCASR